MKIGLQEIRLLEFLVDFPNNINKLEAFGVRKKRRLKILLDSNIKCSFCGKTAHYQFSTGNYCCSSSAFKCSGVASHPGIENGMYGRNHSEKSRLKISENNGSRRPEVGRKISKALIGRKLSPEARKAISEGHKGKGLGPDNPWFGHHHSEKTKKIISKANKGKILSQETRKKMSENNCMKRLGDRWNGNNNPFKKKLMTDPTFAKKWAESLKRKPTKPEIELGKILQNLFPGEYKYVGDFQTWIGGKNPDFMNVNGQKKLIEMFGDYWHRGENPELRIDHFRQFGFETLVVWESELGDEQKLVEGLKQFHFN